MNIKTTGSEDSRFPGQLSDILSKNIEQIEKELNETRKLLANRKRAQKAMFGSKPAVPDLPITMLGLSSRAHDRLRRAGIETLRGITRLSKSELNVIEAFSSSEYFDIVKRLREFGITLDS